MYLLKRKKKLYGHYKFSYTLENKRKLKELLELDVQGNYI